MNIKIYTKKGDKGYTTLYDGTKLLKSDNHFEVLGDIDELNSYVGLLNNINEDDFLKNIQERLLDLGSFIATPETASDSKLNRVNFDIQIEVKTLEEKIDSMDTILKPLKNFILPGGCLLACYSHICRTVCRRAERHLIKMNDSESDYYDNCIMYLNRLSDFFFQYARYCNLKNDKEDIVYKKQ